MYARHVSAAECAAARAMRTSARTLRKLRWEISCMGKKQGGGAIRVVGALAASLTVAGWLGGCLQDTHDDPFEINNKPTNLGEITTAVYDGTAGDLLTAGLGKTGLGAAAAPAPANPAA